MRCWGRVVGLVGWPGWLGWAHQGASASRAPQVPRECGFQSPFQHPLAGLPLPLPPPLPRPVPPPPPPVFLHDKFNRTTHGADESNMLVVTKTRVYALGDDDSEEEQE